jgi:hypothetical protein
MIPPAYPPVKKVATPRGPGKEVKSRVIFHVPLAETNRRYSICTAIRSG